MSRIIFVNRFFFPDHSATSRLVSDLAVALSRDGFSVTAITSRQRYDDAAARLPADETIRGVRVLREPSSRFGRAWLPGRALDYMSFLAAVGWRLLRVTRKGDIVVFKTDPPMLGPLLDRIARIRGARVVNWLQDLFPQVAVAAGLFQSGTGSRVAHLLARYCSGRIRRADACVAIGQSMAERLVDLGIVPTIIDNWCNVDRLQADPAQVDRLREEWGLTDKFVVAYSGNLGRAHPVELLQQAMLALSGDPDIVLLFTGGGAGYETLRAWSESAGLKQVLFKPYQPEEKLPALLAVASVHLVILAPQFEGLIVPSKFSAIAGAGRPAIFIGSPQGQVARWIETADCGETVEEAGQLCAAIGAMKQSPERLAAMGGRARAFARAHFDRTIALDRWRTLVRNLGARPAEESPK